MRNHIKKLFAAILICLGATIATKAQLLFSDSFNYPNGSIESQGDWAVYETYSSSTNNDAFVTNNLLILNQNNNDSVAAAFTNNSAPNLVYASFTINVSSLPTVKGGFFCVLIDSNSPANTSTDEVCRIFIDTTNTVVPGTYRLGIANFATSITAFGATNFPLDLATGITYQVVINWDEVNSQGGTLWINPSSVADQYVYGNDVTNQPLETLQVSRIGFSQYTGQGVSAIGNVRVGLSFGDVMTNTVQIPVIGIQPQGTTNAIYSGNNFTLYTAASGMDVTYQWYSNNVAMTDDGVTVVGSQSNVLNLTNLQNTANYTVVVSDNAGSVTSYVAAVSVNSTLTPPFFTTQPISQTNSLGGAVTLTAVVNGTGPFTYQWYFASTNGSYAPLSGQTSSKLFLSSLTFAMSGSYYLTATGGDGSQNSATATLLVTPPPTVTLAYLHSLLSTNSSPTSTNLNNGTIYNVQGVVASYGIVLSSKYSEYFIQDGTGGAVVFINGTGSNNVPAVGSLVSITGIAQEYYGQLELEPNVTNSVNQVAVISSNNPVNAFSIGNISHLSPLGSYGIGVEGAILTLTNVYLYSSSAGGAISGNFPTNSTKTLYAFQNPYSAGQPYVTIYVTTYTNIYSQLNTNYFGKPIPSFCYQLTGGLDYYNMTSPEINPSRYADFVVSAPAPFMASVTITNGTSTVSWPAIVGSTYSLYSSTNLSGPWTQTFGLGYYPSVGTYTDTNAAGAKFYKISTP